MGRTINFNNANNSFVQGLAANNTFVTLNMLGGNDTVQLNRTDDLGGGCVVNAGNGADGVVSLKESGNIIRLGEGNDTYVGRGFGSFSTDRADTVFGGNGNDLIAVETFKSLYLGEGGNDRFISVGWQNTFNGGAGRDSISYAARDDDSTQGGSGMVVDLAAGLAQTGANRFETLASIEDVIGTAVNDALFGSAGANQLTGGAGLDQMTGRGGADQFVFATRGDAPVIADFIDIIADFSRAQGDKVNLSAIDANLTTTGNQAFTFIGTAAFSNRAGQLRFQDEILSGDVNGDGRLDFRIGLLDITAMLASDIIL